LESELVWNEGQSPYFKLAHRSLYLAHAGRLNEARATISGVADLDSEPSKEVTSYGRTILLLEAAAISGAKAAAPALLQLASGDERLLAKPTFTLVPRHLGSLAALVGDYDKAKACYGQAIDLCERINYRPELALTRVDLSQLLLSHFPIQRTEALRHLDVAIDELEAMDMQPGLERALHLRGRRRASTKTTAPIYPDGLSDREVEVLRLMAAGKSNRQIADELVISLNTVTHHVSNIFNKSGSANRTEAAAYAHRSGLI
jgi:DNA-binding CsgD family transcriptional regulator